jgi:hypothetical protein
MATRTFAKVPKKLITALRDAPLSGELITKDEVDAHFRRERLKNFKGKMQAGKGRKKGSRNKITREVKDVIARCFQEIGGEKTFAEWATNNKTTFYKLYAKLLPIQLQGAGRNGEFVIVVSADDANV